MCVFNSKFEFLRVKMTSEKIFVAEFELSTPNYTLDMSLIKIKSKGHRLNI